MYVFRGIMQGYLDNFYFGTQVFKTSYLGQRRWIIVASNTGFSESALVNTG